MEGFMSILSLLIVAISLPEESGCIRGYVLDYYGFPLIGTTVMISGTSLGDMADSTAHYFISNIPSGVVEITLRLQGAGEDTDSVRVTPGDTTEVNFTLASWPQYLPDISWRHNQETYPDTVFLVIEDSQNLQLKTSQVWADGELFPSWTVNSNVIATALPADIDTIGLRVFPFPEVTVFNAGVRDTISIARDLFKIENTRSIPENHVVAHHFVDIAEWGNPDIVDCGLIASRVFYSASGSMKLLLVYYERAVLVDQDGYSEVFDFPFPTFHYRTDPDCRYLLIWDICGRGDVGGNAAIISLEDGETHIFDPSPEEEIPDRGFYPICTVLGSDWVTESGKYHVLSSGHILRLTGSDFRRYSNEGSLLLKRSIESIGLKEDHFALQFLSQGQVSLSGLFNDDSLNYCFTIDLEGNLVQQISIPFPVQDPVLRTVNISDVDSPVVWMYSDLYGLARVNCITGDCFHLPSMYSFTIYHARIIASHNRKYLGITSYPDNDLSYCEHEVRDWDTGDLIYSVHQDNPSRILGITDTGLCLISETAEDSDSEREYSIHNARGEMVWVFRNATLTGPVNTEATISPTGNTITIPYGRYIDIITLSDLDSMR